MSSRFKSRIASLVLLLAASLPSLAAKESAQNEKILKATDPFEGLTETAIGGDAAKIAKALKAAQAERAATRGLLPAETAQRYDQLFNELTAAEAKHDAIAVSLMSAELYKLLVSSLDGATLVVPKEVNLLDYSGFRSTALLKAAKPDWAALAATAGEANDYWQRIRARVTDRKLQGAMDKAQEGLRAAAAAHDAALAATSAKEDLDLVDELEGFFAKK